MPENEAEEADAIRSIPGGRHLVLHFHAEAEVIRADGTVE